MKKEIYAIKPQPRYQPGDKIGGRYLVHEALMGGMGEVYLCLDLETIRPFALKTFQARYLNNTKILEAFSNEVATWVALEKHPNIVRCFFMDIVDNQPFMFLEWIAGDERRGTDLRSWLQHGPLDLRLALDFTIGICRGLIYADQQQPGIVHSDLKPDNILVTQNKIAKVTDFGLAKIVRGVNLDIIDSRSKTDGRQSLLSQDGVVGTPPYMAPEQWIGEELDARTDIYAIGCILYELLTGSRLFDKTTLFDFRYQHLETEMSGLIEQRKFPGFLQHLLIQCLAKTRGERFACIGELLQQLISIYQEQFGDSPKQIPFDIEFTAFDYNNRGTTYARLYRYEEALSDFNSAIQINSKLAEAYSNRGTTYFEMKQYDKALNDLNIAIRFDPTLLGAYTNRAIIYFSMQLYQEAITNCNQSIKIDPNCFMAYYFRGSSNYGLKLYDEALADFNRALNLNPDYIDVYIYRGMTYDALKRYDEAIADFRYSIKLDPNNDRAYYSLGNTYKNLGNYHQAVESLDHALNLNPKNPDYWLLKGRVLECLDRVEEAIMCFDQAIYINPGMENPWFYKGFVIGKILNHWKEAFECSKQAIKINPNYSNAWYLKGISLIKAFQNYKEALACFEEALRLGHTMVDEFIALCRQELEQKRQDGTKNNDINE